MLAMVEAFQTQPDELVTFPSVKHDPRNLLKVVHVLRQIVNAALGMQAD